MAYSLYRRGLGYEHLATKIFMPAGATEPTYAPYVEHYPPDTPAALAWLSRRQPDLWREQQRLDVNVKGSLSRQLDQMTVEERVKMAHELAAQVRQRLADVGIVIEHEPAREEDEK